MLSLFNPHFRLAIPYIYLSTFNLQTSTFPCCVVVKNSEWLLYIHKFKHSTTLTSHSTTTKSILGCSLTLEAAVGKEPWISREKHCASTERQKSLFLLVSSIGETPNTLLQNVEVHNKLCTVSKYILPLVKYQCVRVRPPCESPTIPAISPIYDLYTYPDIWNLYQRSPVT